MKKTTTFEVITKTMKKVFMLLLMMVLIKSASFAQVPDFTLTDCNYGVTHHLYDDLAAGNTVIINVCAGWCGPCRAADPLLEQVYQDFCSGTSNVKVYGMLFETYNENEVTDCAFGQQYAIDYNLTFPLFTNVGNWNGVGIVGQYFNQYSPNHRGIPAFFIIHPDVANPANSVVETMIAYNDSRLRNMIVTSASGDFCTNTANSATLTSYSPTGNAWSTGETTQSINISASGNYSLTVTNGCGTFSSSRHIEFDPLPVAGGTASTSKTIACLGSQFTLNYSGTEINSRWQIYNNEKGVWFDFAPADQGTVTVTAGNPASTVNGFPGEKFRVKVGDFSCYPVYTNVLEISYPAITSPVTGAFGNHFCPGNTSPITLSIANLDPLATDFHWYPGGETTPSITVLPSGSSNYVVTFYDHFGCANELNTSLYEFIAPVPVINSSSIGVVLPGTPVTLSFKSTRSIAPCTYNVFGQFPSNSINVPCNNTLVGEPSGWAGEYTLFNLTSGSFYGFTSYFGNYINDDLITITDLTGTIVYATGKGIAYLLSNATESVRFYTHPGTGCGSNQQLRARRAQCLNINSLPSRFSWSPGGATTPSITVNPTSTTTYSLTFTVPGVPGCPSTTSIQVQVGSPPAYDNICNAKPLTIGTATSFNNNYATVATGEPVPPSMSNINNPASQDGWLPDNLNQSAVVLNNTVWFSFIAPNSKAVNILVNGFDSQVALYKSSNYTCTGTLTRIAANDNGSPSFQNGSFINQAYCLEKGKKYFIQVDGRAGAQGTGTIKVSEVPNFVTVCHRPLNKKPNAIVIGGCDLPLHLVHGDIVGVCPQARVTGTADEDITTLSLVVYPNPATEIMYVAFSSDKEESYTMRVVDISGRVILSETYKAIEGENSESLNLQSLAKGVYLLMLNKGENVMQTRIVIE